MANAKGTTTTIPTRKSISPFRNVSELEKEIIDFMNIHKIKIADHSKRISDYFEICCFNYIVRFYKDKGYDLVIENLQGNEYRYKCSTAGNQSNFSHFNARKQTTTGIIVFEIHHNLAVQSGHQHDIYTTPDITVIKHKSVKEEHGILCRK